MTQGIKQMEALGFTVSSIKHDKFNSGLVRRFIKYDDKGYITDIINYYYTKVTGVEVYTNSLKYGGGSRLDIELLNAIQLNLDELKIEYELDESLKSARYAKKLTEAKERVKRYSYYEIDEEVYDVDMWEIWYRGRNTQHIKITNRAGDVYKDKTTYYNRTWERFEYQKVLLKLLNKMYKDEKLVDRIAKQVETNMRYVINETSQQGNNKKELDWLLSLPDGFLVAISACRGKDCSRTNELEKILQRKNYIRVTGKWDGIEETSFLVFTESESMARALVKTGIHKFNQDDVYVWKTPMTMADIIEGTDEGTKLDGKYYYFDLDKIIMSRANIKEK
jgi:hypothetical protein